MTSYIWSPGQQDAIATIAAWLRIKQSPFYYLAGYAGTGKTTLARHVAGLVDGKVGYAAFTGKAARVMRNAGCTGARTIHSLIYSVDIDANTGEYTRSLNLNALDDIDLLIVDEVSMVNEEIGTDLLSFGKPILVLGDPFQLPPPDGAGFFTRHRPNYMLTEVHRQAADSEIVRLATAIRLGSFRRRPYAGRDVRITQRRDLDPDAVLRANAVIVGRNATRVAYNQRLRTLRDITDELPVTGEPVICLRNDSTKRIANGEIMVVAQRKRVSKSTDGRKIKMMVVDPEVGGSDPIEVVVFEQFFTGRAHEIPRKKLMGTQQFDFGYCLTAHKAQGSGFENVCVFDEAAAFRQQAARWLYTAVTRASKHLTLVLQ